MIHRSCPACDSNKRTFVYRDRNRRDGLSIEGNFYRCGDCKTGYLSEIPGPEVCEEHYADIMVNPYGSPSQIERNADRIVDTWALAWSRSLLLHGEPRGTGSGKKLLSIGCGYGNRLVKYKNRGYDVYGIDVNHKAVAHARELVGGTFIHSSFEDAQLEDDSFHFVNCDNVFEHAYDGKLFLQKVHRILKPGGVMYCFVPSGQSAMMYLLGKYCVNTWVPFHLNLFSASALKRLAESSGFIATVRSIANPHLASLSIRQWRNRRRPGFLLKKGWDTRVTTTLLAPIWAIANLFRLGEELSLVAQKPEFFSGRGSIEG